MTELRFETKIIRGVRLENRSAFPALRRRIATPLVGELPEDSGVFLNYGATTRRLPYSMQDCYDGPVVRRGFDVAILENDRLRAVFIPALGGRMWSLFDKDAGRDLVVDNPELRPANLGVCDAWFAGGVEWNCGRGGHDPQTCSPLFCAKTTTREGTPVLRMYEFCRNSLVTRQLDIFLPDGSALLFVRARLVNPEAEVTPVSWWSSMAVPASGVRIVTPAVAVYNRVFDPAGVGRLIRKEPADDQLNDATRPDRQNRAARHSFEFCRGIRRFIAAPGPDGYGLIHTSTDRLSGRELFAWGSRPGGLRRQRQLLATGAPDYVEISAGLGTVAEECLPMPPNSAWEWLEAYGAMRVAPAKISGSLTEAASEVAARLDKFLPANVLERILRETKTDFVLKPAETVSCGSGWGALENLRRAKAGLPPLEPHLDFGRTQSAQQYWVELLQNNTMSAGKPGESPGSYQVSDNWFDLLKSAHGGNWRLDYHCGLNYLHRGDNEHAEQCFRKVLTRDAFNVWALHALACTMRENGKTESAAHLLVEAFRLRPFDHSLAKETFRMLIEAKCWKLAAALYGETTRETANLPLVKFLYIWALAHGGKPGKAKKLLLENGGEVPADLDETETSSAALYLYIEKQLAAQKKHRFDENPAAVPPALDLRA